MNIPEQKIGNKYSCYIVYNSSFHPAWKKSCPVCISETVMCRMLVLERMVEGAGRKSLFSEMLLKVYFRDLKELPPPVSGLSDFTERSDTCTCNRILHLLFYRFLRRVEAK